MHILISVANLPATGYASSFDKYLGCQALTSPGGDGVILQMKQYLFEFRCSPSGCAWSRMSQKLDRSVIWAVLSYLPDGYTPTC